MIDKKELSELIRDSLEVEIVFRDYKTRERIDFISRPYYPCINSKVKLPWRSYNSAEYIVKDIGFVFNNEHDYDSNTYYYKDEITVLVEKTGE